MADCPIQLLIIGTLPPPIGGAGVSLQHLVTALQRRDDVVVQVVNTSGVRGHVLAGPFRFVRIVCRILRGARRADVVSLQPAISGVPYIGPTVWLAVRLWKKPLLVRMFGGQSFLDMTGFRGAMTRWIVRRSDLYLVQTLKLLKAARGDRLKRVEWYPTSRPMKDEDIRPRPADAPCRRFVYVGHVKPAKGIRELIEAAEQLDIDGVSVDVYGPLMDGLSKSEFDGLCRVRYCGVIEPGTAVGVISEYDAFVLPTYWRGEGYPGTIMEAYAAGLPVITTTWKAIPEIVDDTSGILLEPKNVEALHKAMHHLASDNSYYQRLRSGVLAKRDFFNSARWVEEFVKHCRSLIQASRSIQTSTN